MFQFSGTMAGKAYQEMGAYFYDANAKGYGFHSIVNDGSSGPGKVQITPGTWVHPGEFVVDKKPMKSRFTLSAMTPTGGAWKYEMSIGGGPWTLLGEGKYSKAM